MSQALARGLRGAAWLAAVFVVSSATCEDGPGPENPRKGVITLKGQLTSEGVSCQAMRDARGTLYTLAGSVEDFRAGDRVCVRGAIAQTSPCQQGTTIAIEWIVPARMCP